MCEPGCDACVGSGTNSASTTCTLAADGYSIVEGIVIKCDPKCKSCLSYLFTVCTECYLGFVLRGGTCFPCSDANALTCSPLNVNYALTCKDGYTGGTYASSANSTGGVCQACASFCKTCLNNGPGQCDSNGCISGTVQIIGTTNCTKCFSGCVKCSTSDPNSCLDCGERRYLNGTACESCPTGCKTCTSNTTCQSCKVGFYLVSSTCTALPAFCVALTSNNVCSQCFAGYALNSASNACTADTACNSNSSCTACPLGFTLTAGQCNTCPAISNCLACDSTNTSACIKCNTGFYLDANKVCQTCSANCVRCDSDKFCTMASTGYYITLSDSNAYTGTVAQCYSTCATCVDHAEFCLSCIAQYTLQGTVCRQNFYIAITLTLGPSATSPIFSSTDSVNQQASNAIRSLHRFGDHFYKTVIPASFIRVASEPWDNTMQMQSLRGGSVIISMNVGAGSNTNTNTATTAMNNAIASSTGSGYSIVSSSVTANGGSSSSSSSANLGLILGLSIPLSILLILIILILVKTRCSDEDEYGTPDKDKENFYSEDRINEENRT